MILITEGDCIERISASMRERRIALKLTQREAAQKSGVSLSRIRRFESKGQLAFESLVSLLFAYGMEEQILEAFEDRGWWTMQEGLNAQRMVRIRHGRKKA